MLKTFIFILAFCWGVGAAVANPANPTPANPASPASPATPAPTADPRIKRYAYNENSVYRLDLYLKSVNALQFSDNEEVQSILIGDSASWEVVKLKSGNVVSIKPIIPSASTNMTIYTDRRVYAFELHSRGEFVAGSGEAPVFRSIFTYPAERKATVVIPTPVKRSINSDYLAAGHAEFRPRWVQDDAHQTSFFMPEGAPRPAIFKIGADRKEQLVNSRTRGNEIVVDGTSDHWVLRIGDESVCVSRTGAIKPNRLAIETAEVSNAG